MPLILQRIPALTLLLSKTSYRLRRRWKLTLILTLSLSMFLIFVSPIRTVKGLVLPTPIPIASSISMDANRIATIDPAAGMISVYDIPSAVLATFPTPAGPFFFSPKLYGDKVVISSSPGLLVASTLSYCILPVPLAACGPWIVLAAGLPTPAALAAWGFPVFHGDLVAWPVAAGFNYYSFHAGGITVVPTPGVQPTGLATNGDLISFASGGILNYVDTTDCIGPCVPAIVATGLPAATTATSISQNVIAFDEPGPPALIRYFDVLSGVSNAAGSGPIGTLFSGGLNSPAIWGDRIVFQATEASIGFDCNGDAVVSAVDNCLRYWNFRNPNTVLLPLASPPMAPGGSDPLAVYDHYVAYLGPGGVKYIAVPMQGDLNQDGVVNISDLASLALCWQKNIKNVVGPFC